MVAVFATPILSVAADAVRDLDGREALSGLWAVFTKCKGSLQNGPRLENIAWRLWHQEMKGPNGERAFVREDYFPLEKHIDEKSAYRPPTPSEILNLPPPYPELPSASAAASSLPAHSSGRGLTSPPIPQAAPFVSLSPSPSPFPTPITPHHISSMSNRRSSFLGGSPRSVGKIICDLVPMLPSATTSNSSGSTNSSSSDLLTEGSLSRKPRSPEPLRPVLQMTTIAPSSVDVVRPSTISLSEVNTSLSANVFSCLPTPELEEGDLSAHTNLHLSYTSITPHTTHQILPQSSQSDIPSSTSTSDTSMFLAASATHTIDSVSLSGQTSHPSHVLSEPRARFSDSDRLPSHILQAAPCVNLSRPQSPSHSTATQLAQTTPYLHTQPPRLVVVQPTPNPTPQPTPPTTPLINGVVPLGSHRPVYLSPPSMNGPPRQQALLLEEDLPAVALDLSSISILEREGAHSAGFVGEPEEFDRSLLTHQAMSEAAMGDYTLRPATILMDNPTTSNTASLAALLSGPAITPAFTSDDMESSPTQRGSPRKHRKRHSRDKSVSSITSRSSEVSHTTSHTSVSNRSSITSGITTSTAFSSDLDGSITGRVGLNGYLDGSRAQVEGDMGGLDSETVAALKRLGSLSTIHSSSTLGARKDALESLEGRDIQMVLVSDEEFEDDEPPTPLSPIRPQQSSAAAKKLKRNSAPPQLTSTVSFSPTKTPSEPRSASITRSTTSTASAKRRTRTATAGTSSAVMSRQSSQARSSSRGGGSGEREDRGRGGRGHVSASNLADLAALGNGGVTIVAAAYPPPAMPAAAAPRKQMAVGATKGRSKVAMAKGLRARGVVRRNSAGPGVDLSGVAEPIVEVMERTQEGETMGTIKLERQPSQTVIQTGFDEGVPRPPSNDRRASEPVLQSQGSQAADEAKTSSPSAATTEHALPEEQQQNLMTASPEAIPAPIRDSIPAQPTQAPQDDSIVNLPSRQAVVFNIGSNSDEGKSAGSGSSISGAHSFAQRYTMMMGQQPLNGAKGTSRLVMDEDKLKARLLQEEERQRREENEMRYHQQQIMRQQQELQQQEIKRQNEAQLMALNQPRVLSKGELRQLQMMQLMHNQHQLAKTSSKPPSRQASAAHLVLPPTDTTKTSEKAKGKARNLVPPPSVVRSTSKHSKNKSKSTPNLAALDPDLAAKVQESLAEPLLPKGRRVVVATESEFETDSEDGSWSSAAMSDENDTHKQEHFKRELARQQDKARQEAAEQEQLIRQLLQHKESTQQVAQPSAIQRTHSAQLPVTSQAKANKAAAQRARQAQALHHAKLEQAAKEAQRQREMIKKVPTESYQDLAQARANSVGLLTQLLNPNPNIFPLNHPYRRGYSQGNIRPGPMQPMQPTTSEPGPSRPPPARPPPAAHQAAAPACPPIPPPPIVATEGKQSDILPPSHSKRTPQPPADVHPAQQRSKHPRRHASTDDGKKSTSRSGLSSPIKAPPMPMMKSMAAMPVSSVVQVGSIAAKGAAIAPQPTTGGNAPQASSGGYRPRGPPKGQEMDDDSGSEAESGTIQVPKSVAEQRLKALAQRRGIQKPQVPQLPAGPSKQVAEDDVPEWARVSHPQQQKPHPPLIRRTQNGPHLSMMAPPPPRTAPIPLGHPYNLPPPAPPTTPRTTRRQMLSTELSESLRRNLLWERQITKNGTVGMKRTASSGGSRQGALNGLQPFTGMPRVVQLHAKGTIPPDQQEDPSKPFPGVLATEQEREEMRKHAMARNRSWANDYHFTGW